MVGVSLVQATSVRPNQQNEINGVEPFKKKMLPCDERWPSVRADKPTSRMGQILRSEFGIVKKLPVVYPESLKRSIIVSLRGLDSSHLSMEKGIRRLPGA